MATFNAAFLNPKLRSAKGTGVGLLSDELTILENQLAADGSLSSGDYDLLISRAGEIRNGGGITTAQRSDFDVRISRYKKERQVNAGTRTGDVKRMNDAMESERAEDVFISGNNPKQFLEGRLASFVAKMDDLTETIERRSAAGDDIAEYQNEFNGTMSQYQSLYQALASAQEGDGKNPVTGYAAFVQTNSRGEIVDIDIDRPDAKTGYVETNGVMDGFQVYGRVNAKKNGENIFFLGNKVFSGADMVEPDPENPLSFRPQRLIDKSMIGGGLLKKAQAGYSTISGGEVPIQSYIPNNSWAKSTSGTYYKRDEMGNYTKYINYDEEKLGIDNEPVLTMPSFYEQRLMRNSMETVDGAMPIMPDEGANMPADISTGMSMTALPSVNPYGPRPSEPRAPVMSKAVNPKERAGAGIVDTAKRTIGSGVDYVKNLFR